MQRGIRAAIPGVIGADLRAGDPAAQAIAQALARKGRTMDGIRQHKQMAAGDRVAGQAGNFGVEPFGQVNGGGRMGEEHPTTKEAYGHQSKLLHDHERGIGKPVGRGKGSMPAQRHPDHGPHMHDSFGVGPIPR